MKEPKIGDRIDTAEVGTAEVTDIFSSATTGIVVIELQNEESESFLFHLEEIKHYWAD